MDLTHTTGCVCDSTGNAEVEEILKKSETGTEQLTNRELKMLCKYILSALSKPIKELTIGRALAVVNRAITDDTRFRQIDDQATRVVNNNQTRESI